MKSIQIYLRVKNKEDLEIINLESTHPDTSGREDILWESNGEYFLEAFQCGTHPSICSIEKDERILNQKEEVALMILDEINNNHPASV